MKCELCDFETNSKIKLSKHILHTHKLKVGEYILQIKYNNINPTCSCGCGQIMIYNPVLGDFPKYNKQHLKKINAGKTFEEIWGDPKSEKRIKAISEGLKKKWKSGDMDKHLTNLKKPRTQEVKDKIGKANKGKLLGIKRPEGFGVGRIQSENTKSKISKTHKEKWITGDIGNKKHYTSKLEKIFEQILEENKIKYIPRFYTPDIKAFYDFRLKNTNILIECDGDFWHCNPINFPEPKYNTQKYNLERDKIKNQWAKNNGYTLLRFWENDINNNPEKIITELKKFI